MKKIVIIGAGQLGSRHLQGIAQSSFDISIEVVEPFAEARNLAKMRYEEIKNNKHVKQIAFYDTIAKISNHIDMVIVATSSDVRSLVVAELLRTKKVNNLVLEKVLFQTIDEYHLIQKLLEETNTSCWVNHARRMLPFYKNLKLKFKDTEQVSYSFQGGDWGIGCNALHFIDHLAFLTQTDELILENKFLDNKIYDSKRKGFIEFNGLLVGKLNNHTFSLYSNEQTSAGILSIVSDTLSIIIDEAKGEYRVATKENNWEWEIYNEKIIYFQSEMSNILLEDILIKNRCYLPTYEEAMKLHIPFIQCLLEHMNKITGKENTLCPVT